MKKFWQVLIIALVVLQVLSIGYFIYLNNETRKSNKLLETDLDLIVRTKNYELADRIHRLESLSAGLSRSVKHIITNEIKELFARGTIFPHTSCDNIRNKFREIYFSMGIMGYTNWFDEEKKKNFTDDEIFIYSFQDLKNKYFYNEERLLAIERIEQCLLNEYLK